MDTTWIVHGKYQFSTWMKRDYENNDYAIPFCVAKLFGYRFCAKVAGGLRWEGGDALIMIGAEWGLLTRIRILSTSRLEPLSRIDFGPLRACPSPPSPNWPAWARIF